MACSTVCANSGGPPSENAALILSLPLPGIGDVGVARDRDHGGRGARAEPGQVDQQDRVGAARRR